MSSARKTHVLPGFNLALGYTAGYLSLIVLIPLAAIFLKTTEMSLERFWEVVTAPRVVASYKLSFGAALLAAAINTVFGFLLAWSLVRYRFPGKRVVDALVDLRGQTFAPPATMYPANESLMRSSICPSPCPPP